MLTVKPSRFFNDQLNQPEALPATLIISSCLSGEAVRYDGKSKPHSQFTKTHKANIIRCCPEMGAGLGVPRPAVHLIANDNRIEAVGLNDETLNVTQALEDFSHRFKSNELPQAFILKSRSPSCGIDNTPVLLADGTVVIGSGIFAAHIRKHYPLSFLLDDEKIQSHEQMQYLLDYCLLLKDLQTCKEEHLVSFCLHHQLAPNGGELSHRHIFQLLNQQLLAQLA